jgi:hypothetical protein
VMHRRQPCPPGRGSKSIDHTQDAMASAASLQGRLRANDWMGSGRVRAGHTSLLALVPNIFYTCLLDYITKHTERPKVFSAAVLFLSSSLSVSAGQAMHSGNGQTGHILHIKFISGHAQARMEANAARPSKHAMKSTIQQGISPN